MLLPNSDRAVVDVEKLRDYCLNPAHPRGRHKARVFAAALGLTADRAEELRETLLGVAAMEEATPAEEDFYGRRYVIDFQMKGPHGPVGVRAIWIVRADEDFPRLTTCFVTSD